MKALRLTVKSCSTIAVALCLSLCWPLYSAAATVSAEGIDVDALLSELQAKTNACRISYRQSRDKTQGRGCHSACGSGVKSVKAIIQREVYTAEDLNRYQQICDSAMARAGVTLDDETPPVTINVPTLKERLVALPEKTAFCKSHYQALDCLKVLTSRSTPEKVNACQTYSGCSCDPDVIAYNIANKHKLRKPHMAIAQLDKCERYYIEATQLPPLH